jgi:hypothetical protein
LNGGDATIFVWGVLAFAIIPPIQMLIVNSGGGHNRPTHLAETHPISVALATASERKRIPVLDKTARTTVGQHQRTLPIPRQLQQAAE